MASLSGESPNLDAAQRSVAVLRRSASLGCCPTHLEHVLSVRPLPAIPWDGFGDVGADGRGVHDLLEPKVAGLEDRGAGAQDTSQVVEEDSVEEAQADALLCRPDRADPSMSVTSERVREDSVLERDIEVGLGGADCVIEGNDDRGRHRLDGGKVVLKGSAAHEGFQPARRPSLLT